MSIVNFDLKDFDDWFKEETVKSVLRFISAISTILDEVDSEIEDIQKLDLGESVVERMIRDVKAAAYNQIELSTGELF